jgi:hypothetical protein
VGLAEPLTKINLATGEVYTRPPTVEHAIDEALLLSGSELNRRITVSTAGHSEFIPSEVVVHLARRTRKDNSEAKFRHLYETLTKRVATHLPKGRGGMDEFVRQTVLDVFVDRICEDRTSPGEALDFAECKFALFVANLVRDARSKYRRSLGRETELGSGEDEDGVSATSNSKLQELLEGRLGDFDDPMFRKELLEAISLLKPEQRRQVMLIFQDLKDSSKDPNEKTVASMLGISDRQVRNRKKEIIEALRRIMIEGVEP